MNASQILSLLAPLGASPNPLTAAEGGAVDGGGLFALLLGGILPAPPNPLAGVQANGVGGLTLAPVAALPGDTEGAAEATAGPAPLLLLGPLVAPAVGGPAGPSAAQGPLPAATSAGLAGPSGAQGQPPGATSAGAPVPASPPAIAPLVPHAPAVPSPEGAAAPLGQAGPQQAGLPVDPAVGGDIEITAAAIRPLTRSVATMVPAPAIDGGLGEAVATAAAMPRPQAERPAIRPAASTPTAATAAHQPSPPDASAPPSHASVVEAARPNVPAPAPSAPAASAVLPQQPTPEGGLDPSFELPDGAVGRAEPSTSETQRAAPSDRAPAPPTSPAVQVGVQIAKAAHARIERLFVQLEPASLGRVEVRLEFRHDNHVSAVIAAERPETLDALQRDGRALERSLQDAGLRLDSGGLTFSLRREQPQGQQQHARFAPGSAGHDAPADAGEEAAPVQWRGMRVLDIRV